MFCNSIDELLEGNFLLNSILTRMTLTPPTTVIPKLPRNATNIYTNTDVSSSMLSSSVVVNDDDDVEL